MLLYSALYILNVLQAIGDGTPYNLMANSSALLLYSTELDSVLKKVLTSKMEFLGESTTSKESFDKSITINSGE